MAENQKLHVDIIGDSSKLNQALGRAEGRLKKFSGSLTRTGRALTTRLTLPLAAVGTMAVKQAANFEKLQTTLNVLTGSAEDGAKAFERLVKFSAKTPFQLGDLVKVNNTLMGFGLTTDKAFNSLSMLGDVAGIVGGDLQSIAIAFGQAAAEGRVMTRDLRQFINNGVPILQVLSEEMGVAEGAIMDMASEGKITFELLDRAFRSATAEGGKFENGMETLSGTLNGLFSTLKDNVNIALAELGQEIATSLNLKEGIPALSKGIGQTVEGFQNLNESSQKLILILGGAAGLFPLIAVFVGTTLPLFITGFTALTSPVIVLTGAVVGLTAALNKLLDIDITKLMGSLGGLGVAGLVVDKKIKKMLAGGAGADVPAGFVGPLGPSQGRKTFSLVQPKGTFRGDSTSATAISETAEAFTGLSESAASLHQAIFGFIESAGTGINTVVRPALSSLSPIITGTDRAFSSLGEKSKETISFFENFGSQILPQVGQALADSFASIADGEAPLKRLITTVKALVVRLMAAAAAALVLSVLLKGTNIGKALGGFSGIFGKLTNFKIGGAIKTGAQGFMGMAQGGLAFGQTPVMVGDYSGVRSNPEVIAPLNKLKAMIGGGSQNVTGEFVLRGQDLVVALQRAERNRNRFK